MSDTVLIWLNLGISSGALLLVFWILVKISHKLARIEHLLGSRLDTLPEGEKEPGAHGSPGGAFETFLEGDPARRDLPKNEQFAAYRRWRKENAMNWSK